MTPKLILRQQYRDHLKRSEGPNEDWFCQLGHSRKIKNLLTYFTYLLTYSGTGTLYVAFD